MDRIHAVEGYEACVIADLENAEGHTCVDQINTSPSVDHIGHWKILLMGQGIALIAASANACCFTLIYNLKVDVPISELFLLYLTLALIHVRPVLSRNGNTKGELSTSIDGNQSQPGVAAKHTLFGSRIKLHVAWWVYGLVALLDLLANLSTLLSFRYTSLTSASLLGSLTIPSVMLVSRLFMGRVFSSHHFVGTFLCMLGGTMTVWLDTSSSIMDNNSKTGNSFLGDALAITAALLYGLGDCLAEYSIKHMDRVEYLFMIGLCGVVLTGLVLPLLEGRQLGHLLTETHAWMQLQAAAGIVFYVSGVVLYYISATLFLVHGDATLLVLSLQATQFWAILFSVVAEHHPPTPWFFVAVVLVVSGVIQYETRGATSTSSVAGVVDDVAMEKTTLISTREQQRPHAIE
jgi:drug/metabolite transporter (DMT)-like permease